ncbi:MAG: zinc metalloprotease HtpX [Deltaproteobacteria bacterium]|nr:zinc metalloprotease HtpX [Deltaproteobacteria bacterium]
MGNQIKTTVLLAALTGIILWIGGMFGGKGGMLFAFILAGGMNFSSYWYSDKIVLRMYKAEEITPETNPGVYRIVERLADNAGIPMPRIYVIPQEALNAFATGRNPENAVIAVTRGLLEYMNEEELAGVIGHEMGHIKHRDILIGSIAATMAGAIMMIAGFARWAAIFGGFSRSGDSEDGGGIFGLLLMSIIAPIAAVLIQMAISRSREFMADRASAEFNRNSHGLANALAKLGSFSKQIPMKARPETAHMFIVNPLSRKSLANLFSTHPPIEERIAKLTGVDSGRSEGRNQGNYNSPDNGMENRARNFWDTLK